MARSLSYTPPPSPYDPARHEAEDLIDALHESGLLRALAGGARAYPDLLRELLRAVDADTLRSVIALSSAVTRLDPEASDRVADGLRRARSASADAARGRPEGPRQLWRRLRDPDTRRGLAAALAALSALGHSLGAPSAERAEP